MGMANAGGGGRPAMTRAYHCLATLALGCASAEMLLQAHVVWIVSAAIRLLFDLLVFCMGSAIALSCLGAACWCGVRSQQGWDLEGQVRRSWASPGPLPRGTLRERLVQAR
mmetsp:Transcript_42888/g.122311  ORF Transcript_42888/g.122311 Transcript_42888/m.122311 type:complete len:111 (-) Transcript_42888:22-354(-)